MEMDIDPPPSAVSDQVVPVHSDTTCYFFHLPCELRDIIYECATAGNIHIDRYYEGEKIKAVWWPAPSTHPHAKKLIVPTLLYNGQIMNEAIFNESLPILIRNTVFDFRPGKFCCSSPTSFWSRSTSRLFVFTTTQRTSFKSGDEDDHSRIA